MNKLSLVVVALALCAVPVTAIAANATPKPLATVTTAASALTSKSTFAEVMASVAAQGKAGATAVDLSKVKSASVITVMPMSKLKGYSSTAMKISSKSMVALDEKVAANTTLAAALKKAGDLPTDVATVSVDAKGNATVFVTK